MSFVTSCPECTTNFIVRPEHLSAQRGMVRCGKCNQVFNALDRLNEPAAIATPTDNEESAITESVPEIHISEQKIEISDASTVSKLADEPTGSSSDNSDVIPWPLIPSDAVPASEEIPHILRDVALKGKLNNSRKRKVPGWLLFIFSFLLILLIALQAVYYLRTNIAIQWPVLKPHLVQACKLLACKVELPKNADLLVIDDSDLHEDPERKGLIHLTSTMINNAPYAQSYPLLELTLTDANDTPLLRRSFKPVEYLPATSKLDSGIPAGEEVHINLALTAGEVPIAGYRVFVTY
ncbi:MAG TPA: zinc-ribbon and DUF3426 domain-containing protein [Methylophilaceae bacterium]|nr:zinc-ribbon and DUF3426 domain-containing protein [Methylophilaceae bacterium]